MPASKAPVLAVGPFLVCAFCKRRNMKNSDLMWLKLAALKFG
jgi:hypothetical protein